MQADIHCDLIFKFITPKNELMFVKGSYSNG